jgi:diguanylate cyclase (GGDEF)-like protein
MLHAPLATDLPPIPAPAALVPRLEAEPAAASDGEGLQLARAEVLWRTAPAFGGIVLLCTILGAWFMRDAVPPIALIGWSLSLIAGTALMMRGRRAAFSTGDLGSAAPEWWTGVQVAVLAVLWLSLPVALFPGQSLGLRALVAGLTCLLMASGVLLVVLPAAAAWWSGTLGAVLAAVLLWDGGLAMLPYATLVLAYLVALFTGASHAARLVREHVGSTIGFQRRFSELEGLVRTQEEIGREWLWQTDAANRLEYVSPGLATLAGRSRTALAGVPLTGLLGGDAALGRALIARQRFADVEVSVEVGGQQRRLLVSGAPKIVGRGGFEGFRGTITDVTEQRAVTVRLAEATMVDTLTGLPNRQRLHAMLADALARAQAQNRSVTLFTLAVDRFKPFNDAFGDAEGDAVLCALAARLSRELGDTALLARIGGDEFAVLAETLGSAHAVDDMAHRLLTACRATLDDVPAERPLTLSIGSATGPIDAPNAGALLTQAQHAVRRAKADGGSVSRRFDRALQQQIDQRRAMEDALRQAVARREFAIHYQPLVDARSREVTGFEALLRWSHPVFGQVSPAVFVPIAEEIGLIGQIGEWVLRTACHEVVDWPETLTVAVNVSACQLLNPGFAATVSDALTAARLPASRLELEVTEGVFLDDAPGALEVLQRIRQLGVGIALDDFGTGYSSLGYLNKTIFHKLKIDGSFVREAAKNPETVSIIRAIVDLARSFRMSIVAEGVETPEDYARMRDLGCHQMQGWLFGRPMPLDQATALVGTRWDRAAS